MPAKKIIRSRAPVRILDIGGWTDTWFCKNGAVLNIAVDLYTHITLMKGSEHKNDISFSSHDLQKFIKVNDIRKAEYDGNLDLLKAAVKRMQIKGGLNIYVRADAPPGCGVGTSASVSVALIGALSKYTNQHLTNYQIAELAHKLEVEELKMQCGVQDQFASAFGGINFMEIEYPKVKISQLKLANEVMNELEERLILVYLGSRLSSNFHEKVIGAYESRQKRTVNAFDTLIKTAYKMKDALIEGNINKVGEIMNENWNAQKSLHQDITNPLIEKVHKIALSNNAIGFKVNGAGGGGSAVILCGLEKEHQTKTAFLKENIQILPFKLNTSGLQSWTTL